MDLFKKINLLISGSSNVFSLKQRIFSSSTFWISMVAILFAIFSVIENNIFQIVISITGVISFILIYFYSRKKNKYNSWLFLFVVLFYLSSNWFFFNGLNGPSLFLFILGILIFYGIFERKYYPLILIIVVLNILSIWLIEFNFPNLIFSEFNYNFTYIIISFALTSVFAGLIISQLKFNFEEEHLKTERERLKIENLHNDILGSIKYAKNIQTALLPSPELLASGLRNYFILYKPKEVVSGDFYWIKKIENKTIFAVADCTGHGVPGAFMSMLGISYLNELVTNNNTLPANEILNKLREKVKMAFIQNNKSTIADGMDIALCIIDFDKMKLQYSGAYSPLYIIRENLIIEYKADRQPIGDYPKEKEFSLNKIDLQKNDVLYLFSDGYKDQKGGEKNKKFMAKQFKELLLSIHKNKLIKQKEILNITFENWKNKNISNQKYSDNELENILTSINKELVTNKIKEANSIISKLKNHVHNHEIISISDFRTILNELKINQQVKQNIINKVNLQVDDVIVAGIKI